MSFQGASDVGISRYQAGKYKGPGETVKFTGTFSVKMYLTFLARVDIIKMWKP